MAIPWEDSLLVKLVIVDNRAIKLMRGVELTDEQKSVVIGSMLGDGYLDRTTMGYSLRLHHGVSQKDYVFGSTIYLKT